MLLKTITATDLWLKEWMELQSRDGLQQGHGSIPVEWSLNANGSCWLGSFDNLPALLPCFSLFTAHFGCGMFLYEGECSHIML